jgi:3-oxoacyl-[acyl-carrier protein] reductase
MSDLLLQLAHDPRLKGITKSLPIPLPPELKRATGRWKQRELEGKRVLVVDGATNRLADTAREVVSSSAAELVSAPLGDDERVDGIVLDATGIASTKELRALYEGLHPTIGHLSKNGRIVVLADDDQLADPGKNMADAGIEAFVRSVAKEIGRKGSTANLLRVGEGADQRLSGPLRFFLSDRSTFISAQPLRIRADWGDDYTHTPARILGDKLALVTGSVRGIGRSIAETFAREGAQVVVLDLPSDEDKIRSFAREIGGTPMMVDITEDDAPDRIAEQLAELGGVDIVVHNAGITRDKTLKYMKDAQWDSVIGVNLDAALRLHERLEAEVLNDDGRVVFLGSVAGIAGNVGQTAYSVTKAGGSGLARSLAPRLAERGITANAVAPGFIETRMTDEIPLATREVARRLAALSQGGLPSDVAEAIAFLASPNAQGVSGETLRVCGAALIGA